MRVRLRGKKRPGARFGDADGDGCVYDRVMVGVQRGRDIEQLAPGDAGEVTFELDLRPNGDHDARGPYAHGRAGERFLYLCWVAGDDRSMFRRAKLMLADIPPDVWRRAHDDDRILEGTLTLTDARGGPLCARVKPGAIRWAAVPGDVDPSP